MKSITNPDANGLLNGFSDWLLSNGKSENTVKTYLRNTELFIKWYEIESESCFDGFISDRIARKYLVYLENYTNAAGSHFSLSSIKAKLTALQIFCNFLHDKYESPVVSVPQKKGSIEPKVETLTKKELNKVLDYLDRKGTLLQKCVISILLNTGLRVSEVVNLELSDVEISPRKGMIKVRSGKGDKYREVPLNNDCRKAITAYLAIRQSINDSHLLIGQRGPMTRNGIYTMVSTLGKESINRSIHPHLLRHQLFTTMSKTGIDIKTISSIAGHGNINTTAKYYIASSWEDKESAVNSISF